MTRCYDRIGTCAMFGCHCPKIPANPTKVERELLAAVTEHGPLNRQGLLAATGRDPGYMGAGGMHPVRQAIFRLGLRQLARVAQRDTGKGWEYVLVAGPPQAEPGEYEVLA